MKAKVSAASTAGFLLLAVFSGAHAAERGKTNVRQLSDTEANLLGKWKFERSEPGSYYTELKFTRATPDAKGSLAVEVWVHARALLPASFPVNVVELNGTPMLVQKGAIIGGMAGLLEEVSKKTVFKLSDVPFDLKDDVLVISSGTADVVQISGDKKKWRHSLAGKYTREREPKKQTEETRRSE